MGGLGGSHTYIYFQRYLTQNSPEFTPEFTCSPPLALPLPLSLPLSLPLALPLARVRGVEPRVAVLETAVLPLH